MIITCPNCQSRYEIAAQALGDRGRKVECANCHANWKALPVPESPASNDDDQLFTSAEEEELDAFFEAEEARTGAKRPAEYGADAAKPGADRAGDSKPVDKERLARQRRALARRQMVLKRNLPQARLRRGFRMAMAVMLMTLIGGGIYLREPIVRSLPDLAGVYAAIGLPVNVTGIEFQDAETLRSQRNGVEVLGITANLVNVKGTQVPVPPVLVSLLNDEGATIFEWSVVPQAQMMQAGDWAEFSTQLTAPPEDAARLRLTFLEH